MAATNYAMGTPEINNVQSNTGYLITYYRTAPSKNLMSNHVIAQETKTEVGDGTATH